MAQVNDYEITPSDARSGAEYREAVNNTLEAIVTQNSGLSAPTTTYPFMKWVDTGTNYIYERDATNSVWTLIGHIVGDEVVYNDHTHEVGAVNNIIVSAYSSGSQSLSVLVSTKVLFQTELVDSHNIFDNSRLTPTKAGWYRINVRVALTGAGTLTRGLLQLIKNGTVIYNDDDNQFSATVRYATTSRLVYLNGTTDYLEAYVLVEGASATTRITNQAVIFEAEFIRG